MKDVRPPQIDSAKSTPNPSLNFKGREIVMAFDEWVKLEDVSQQVVITPPLNHRPDIRLKGRSVRIEIDPRDSLRQNTTYIINMGQSVKDLTEGNVPPNLRFVFSTGPEIDSLSWEGQVFDLESGKGAPEVLVMLYEEQADSVVYTQKPYYLATTDESGLFKLDYLKPGTYKIFALDDANGNYLYDQPQESIAFTDSLLHLPDSSGRDWSFRIFQEEQPLAVLETQARQRGWARVLLNREDARLSLDSDQPDSAYFWAVEKDSLHLWYGAAVDTAENIRFFLSSEREEDFRDTVSFRVPNKGGWPGLDLAKAQDKQRLSPKDSFTLAFNQPVAEWRTDSLLLLRDSTDTLSVEIRRSSEDPRRLSFAFDRKGGPHNYALRCLPGAFRSLGGRTTDTLDLTFATLPAEEFGEVQLSVLLPDSSQAYLLGFLDKDGQLLSERQTVGRDSVFLTFKTLPPGEYSLRVVEDGNANGRRDSGSYDEQRQPERIFQKKLEALRKNWVLETKVEVVF